MNLFKLVKRLRDGKDRLILNDKDEIVVETNGEVLPKDEIPSDVYELLREHAECTQEQQGIIARLFAHSKGAPDAK